MTSSPPRGNGNNLFNLSLFMLQGTKLTTHYIWRFLSRVFEKGVFFKTIEQSLCQYTIWFGENCFLAGYFTYIGGLFKAKLEGPSLQLKPFHQSIGFCLRFNYLMPTQSKSTLKLFLRELKREEPVLKWQLVGNHGDQWSAAQVAWSGAMIDQVKTITHW